MRQLAFAAALLALASLTAPASADSEPGSCSKPVVRGTIPGDGATDVPLDTRVRAWIGATPIDCSIAYPRYWFGLSDDSGLDLDLTPYVEITREGGALPANSEVGIRLEEDGVTVWSATFTTGSTLAAPPVAPSEVELVSFTFTPQAEDGASYLARAHVRFRPSSADPLTSAVLTAVGGAPIHVRAPGEDGWYDMTLGANVQAGATHCVRPGLENAAGHVAYGEPLCADAPMPAPESGCSIGTGARGKGGAALVGFLVGVAGAVVRRVRRRHDGTPLKP